MSSVSAECLFLRDSTMYYENSGKRIGRLVNEDEKWEWNTVLESYFKSRKKLILLLMKQFQKTINPKFM